MNQDEVNAKFFLRVDEVVNVMMGIGETIKESVIVQKTLRSLLSKFNPKVSAIEEIANFETVTKDQLLGSLTTYEIIISIGKSATRDVVFKEDKHTKQKEGSWSNSNE